MNEDEIIKGLEKLSEFGMLSASNRRFLKASANFIELKQKQIKELMHAANHQTINENSVRATVGLLEEFKTRDIEQQKEIEELRFKVGVEIARSQMFEQEIEELREMLNRIIGGIPLPNPEIPNDYVAGEISVREVREAKALLAAMQETKPKV